MSKTWWKESVVYQIYPRSFKDSNGDGIGDIPGIISKLDYVKSLGVDVIWVCPVYKSPNDDNGYDISDYRDIMDEFGTMEDFDLLLQGVHERGMKLIMDLVPNHTSDEHRWFEESRKSKDNPYRDYYYWRKGENDAPPNNWPSFFSGNAWEYDEKTDEYYLHLFSKKQPDLNWENSKVRKEVYKVIEFWLEKGIDGFRMDVVSLISKQQNLPNAYTHDFNEIINKYYANGPRVHAFLQEMNNEVLGKYDIMTVGEGPGIDLGNGLNYVDEERKELNMIFHFGHMFIDNGPGGKYDPVEFSLVDFKNIFNAWDEALKDRGWGSIFLGNHDFSRMVSRFGNDREYRSDSAKLLVTLLLTLRGTVYLYQGDEIGMTNTSFESIDDYNDIETINSWKEQQAKGVTIEEFMPKVHKQSRDNARTPMQWDSSKNAGFSTSDTTWIKMNPNHNSIHVEEQEEKQDSILNYYREMIRFRKEHLTMVYGDYQSIDNDNEYIFAYRRWDKKNDFLVVHNFSDNEIKWDHQDDVDLDLVKSNLSEEESNLIFKPWQSKIFKRKK